MKYPNGKPGSAMHDRFLESQKPAVTPSPAPVKAPATIKQVEILKETPSTQDEEKASEEKVLTVTESELDKLIQQKMEDQRQAEQPKPEVEKPSFFKRVLSFFRGWF